MSSKKTKRVITTFILAALTLCSIYDGDSVHATSERITVPTYSKEQMKTISPAKERTFTLAYSKEQMETISPAPGQTIAYTNEIEQTPTPTPAAGELITPTPTSEQEKSDHTDNARLHRACIDTLARITTDGMSDKDKLRAAWKFLTGKGFSKGKYISLSDTSWARAYALEPLSKRKGNTYAYNAAFAALASEIGYHARLYVGTTYKNKKKKKGSKKLSFVKIGSRYYDVSSHRLKLKKNVYNKKKYKLTFFANAGYDFYSEGVIKGIYKVAGQVYGFDKKGKVVKATKGIKVKKIKKNQYLAVNKKGRATTGWVVSSGKLYLFKGRLKKAVRNKKVDGITFSSSCKAKKCLNTSVKIKTIKVLNKITKKSYSKKKKLRKVFNWLSSHKNFHYEIRYPNLSSKSWIKKYANYMLSSHGGNCYGFASTFASLAYEIGYDPYVVCGRVRGSRDHASDGYTRHACVKINGRYYDPEANWAGFRRNVFNKKSYPMSFINKKSYRYKKSAGSNNTDKDGDGTNDLRDTTPKVTYNDGYYYGYDIAGNPLQGAYIIDGRLYVFDENACMSQDLYEKCQQAIAEGALFANLIEILGAPVDIANQGDSCYKSDGEDWICSYEHIQVYVFHPYEGENIVIAALAS